MLIYLPISSCGGRSIAPGNVHEDDSRRGLVSEEKAITISKTWGEGEFTFEHCDVSVEDEQVNWKVVFMRKPKYLGYEGGCPIFWIDKKTGAIVSVLPNK